MSLKYRNFVKRKIKGRRSGWTSKTATGLQFVKQGLTNLTAYSFHDNLQVINNENSRFYGFILDGKA